MRYAERWSKHFIFSKWLLALAVLASFTVAPSHSTAATGMTYHGRILKPNGRGVESASVFFHIQIRSPGGENCLLFDEQQTLNMTGSDGIFVLTIGEGTRSAPAVDGGYPLDKIFANRGSLTGLTCNLGNSYSPGFADGRKLQVQFNDGSAAGWQTLPPQNVNYVPLAIEATQISGYDKDQLLRVADGVVATELSAANWSALWDLITGASTVYSKADGSNFNPSADVSFNNKKILNLADPTTASGAATKNYVDTNFLGRAGGTMTGAINMGSQSVTNVGHIVIASQGTLYLGKFTNAQEAALVINGHASPAGPLDASDAGRTWYNTDVSLMKYWDGAAVQIVGSKTYIDALVASATAGLVQSVSGTAGEIASSGGVNPVLSLVATGVTAGSYGGASNIPQFAVDSKGRITSVSNVTVDDTSKVKKAGDTMTGLLLLSADPSNAVGAATKQYVDAVSSAASGAYLRKDGTSVMTGDWDIDGIAGTGFKITGLKDPTALDGAATKNYVDTTVSGAVSGLGDITDVTAGTGLSGGGTSGNVTLNLANTSVVAGSYGTTRKVPRFQVDAQGRLVAVSEQNIDVPGALGYNPVNKAGDTMSGNLVMNNNSITSLLDPTGAQDAATKNYADTKFITKDLPAIPGAGQNGQSIRYNGTAWEYFTPAAGTVNSVTNVAGETSLGGTATNPIIGLANSGVVAGSYGTTQKVPRIQVDAKGRVVTVSEQNIDVVGILGFTPLAAVTNSASLGSTKLWVGDVGGKAQEVSLNGDIASVSNAGAVALATTGVTAGSYGTTTKVPRFQVDAKGRLLVVAEQNIDVAGALGYTPTDATKFITKNLPAAPGAGQTNQSIRYNGTAWEYFSPAAGTVNSVTNVAGETSLGGTGTDPIIGLANSGVVAGSYGTTQKVPRFQVDAKGRLIAVSEQNIDVAGALGYTPVKSVSGTAGQISNTGTAQDPVMALVDTAVVAGSYGAAGKTLQVAVDSKGRLTSASAVNIAINPSQINAVGANSGEVLKWNGTAWAPAVDANSGGTVTSVTAGTGINMTGTAAAPVVNLANTAVGAGSYGTATKVPRYQVDAQGRLVAAQEVNIDVASALGYTPTDATKFITKNLPAAPGAGQTNQSIRYNGTAWEYFSPAAGTVNSVGAGTGMSASGTAADPILNLANTAVVAGSYGTSGKVARFQVDAQGRLVAATEVDIVANIGNVSSLANGKMWLGDIGGKAQEQTMSGDATISNTGALTLSNSGVTAGSYGTSTKVLRAQFDSKGRAIATQEVNIDVAGALGYTPVKSISGTAGQISNTGTATDPVMALVDTAVVAGSYGTLNKVARFQVDSKGRIVAATEIPIVATVGNTSALANTKIWIGDGAGKAQEYSVTGDASLSNLGALTLATTGVSAGSYGTTTKVPRFQVDTKGRVVTVAEQNIDVAGALGYTPADATKFITKNLPAAPGAGQTNQSIRYNGTAWEYFSPAAGTVNSVSGTAGETANTGTAADPVIALVATGVSAGSYGTTTKVPRIQVDSKGRLVTVAEQNINVPGALGLGAPGSGNAVRYNGTAWEYFTPSTGTVTGVSAGTGISITGTAAAPVVNLANTAVSAGSYGTSSKVPRYQVDAQGRLVAAQEVNIAINPSQINAVGANSGEVLKWNGSAWAPAVDNNSGTVTSVSNVAGETSLGGTASAPTIGLATISGLTAGSYGSATQVPRVAIDAKGRITAVTLTTIDDSTKLPKAGGTMTGAIAMGTNIITGMGDPTLAQDAATKNYVDTRKLSDLSATTSAQLAGIISDETGTAGNLVFSTSPSLTTPVLNGFTLKNTASGVVNFQVPSTSSGTYTWPSATPSANSVLQSSNTGALTWVPAGAASSLPLSGLTAATATNTIDSLNFAQTWNWSTASTQTPISINANALTTGSMLSLATSNASVNSTNGLLYVANTSAGTSGTIARIQSNSTAGSGLTVKADGSVGVGTDSPSAKLQVAGNVYASGSVTSTDGFSAYVWSPTVYSSSSAALPPGLALMGHNSQGDPGTAFSIEFGSSPTSHAYISAITPASGNTPALAFVQQTGAAQFDESMRLDNSRNLLIGKTSSANGKLDVQGTLAISGATSGAIKFNAPTTVTSGNYTWPSATPSANSVLQSSNTGALTWVPAGAASSLPLSGLTAATATNTIDSLNFAQTWNWSTASTQTPISINANALTTGSMLSLATSNASVNSTNGLLYVANTSAGTSGTIARIQSNSTAGSGLTVKANGGVLVGTTTSSLGALEVRAAVAGQAAFFAPNATTSGIALSGNGSGGTIQAFTNSGSDTKMMIDTNGQGVMFGTANAPLSKVDIAGGVAIGTYAGNNAAPSNGLIVSGNVGIGTNSPAASLDINKAITGAAGTAVGLQVKATSVNQSGTAGYTGLLIDIPSETATGSGSQLLIDARYNSGSRFWVDRYGGYSFSGTGEFWGLSSFRGGIQLPGSTSGNIKFYAPAVAGTQNYTWPLATPASNMVLQSDNTGQLSWVAQASGGYSAGSTILAGAGTNAAPSLSFNGDPDTGLYSNGANIIGFSAGGTNVLNISSSSVTASTSIQGTSFNIGGVNAIRYPAQDTTVGGSIAVGPSALASMSGSAAYGNIGMGYESLTAMTTGSAATAVGYQAAKANTTSSNITAFGYQAATAFTAPALNIYSSPTAIGSQALKSLTTGGWNTAVGRYSLGNIDTGISNTAVGDAAAQGKTFGSSENTALGAYALYTTGTSSRNTAIGVSALYANTTGAYNTAIGFQAAMDATTGANNIVIGSYPTLNVGITTGSNNILVGNDVRAQSVTANDQLNIGNLLYATGLGSGATASTGNFGIKTSAPVDMLSLGAPVASNTRASINLANRALSGASANGTYIGANPAAAGADFLRYQVNGTNKYYVDVNGASYQASGLWIDGGGITSKIFDNTAYTSTGATDAPVGMAGNFYNYGWVSNSSLGGISLQARNASLTSMSGYVGVLTRAAGNSPDMVFGLQTGPSAYNERMRIDINGNLGVNTTSPNEKITVDGAVSMKEQASSPSLTASFGKVYAKTDAKLYYMNSAGAEYAIGGAGTNYADGSTIKAANGAFNTPSLTFNNDADTGMFLAASDTIGFSSGGSSRFNLSSSGLVSTSNGGGIVTSAAGSATAPTFSFAGDPNTGWFSPAADTLAAATGGTERMRIDSNGRVGIGTGADTLNSTLEIREGAAASLVVTNTGAAGSPYSQIWSKTFRNSQGQGDPSFIGYMANGTLASPSPVNKGYNLVNFVGRGYAENNGWGPDKDGASIQFQATQNWGNSVIPTRMIFNTGTNGTWNMYEHMRLEPTGRLGIGTTAPAGTLEVAPSHTKMTTATASQSGNGITGTGFSAGMVGKRFTFSDGTDAGTVTAYNSATSLTVSTSQTVAAQPYQISYAGLVVDTTGKVGVGNAAPGYNLDITGDGNITGKFWMGNPANNPRGYIDSSGTVTDIQGARNYIGLKSNVTISNALAIGPTYFPDDLGAGTGGLIVTGNTAMGGTLKAQGPLSVSPLQYNTGTASQSGTTVTGVGTSWTGAMTGSQILLGNGVGTTAGTITAVNSATSLTVSNSQTVASTSYNIYYAGLQVTSTGRVGIGTNSPSATLEVYGSIKSGAAGILSQGLVSASQWKNTVYVPSGGTDRIPHGGGGAQIYVQNPAPVDGVMAPYIVEVSNTAGTVQSAFMSGVSSTSGYAPNLVFGQQTGASTFTERMRLDPSGNLGIGVTTVSEKLEVSGNVKATSFISTSDARLKKNVETVSGLDVILKLRGVSWLWKSNDVQDSGVIAQEIEKVIPAAVVTGKDGFKAVKYNAIIANIIESTKDIFAMMQTQARAIEQNTRAIASVKQDVKKLEVENSELKNKVDKLSTENEMMKQYLCGKDPSAPFCK